MSVQFAKVLVPPPVAVSRGAERASAVADKLARFAQAVWRRLEAAGQARADRELRRLASQYAHQPEFARTLRDAMHRSAMHRDSQH
jgi:hypothetical protein